MDTGVDDRALCPAAGFYVGFYQCLADFQGMGLQFNRGKAVFVRKENLSGFHGHEFRLVYANIDAFSI